MKLFIVHLRVAHPKDGVDNRRYGIAADNEAQAAGKVLSFVNASFGRDHFAISYVSDGETVPVRRTTLSIPTAAGSTSPRRRSAGINMSPGAAAPCCSAVM